MFRAPGFAAAGARSVVTFAVDLSLTVLSERVHRGSLANARSAIAARQAHDVGSDRAWEDIQQRFVRAGTRRPAPVPARDARRLALVDRP